MATLRQPRHHIHNIFLNNFGLSPSENKNKTYSYFGFV